MLFRSEDIVNCALARGVDGNDQAAAEGWQPMASDDIPTRANLARLTLELMRRGMTNTDEIRDRLRRNMKLTNKDCCLSRCEAA